jgi:hypothetical protein
VEGALYTGGEVVTLEPGLSRAEALATRGDRILAVGSEASCREARLHEHVRALAEVDPEACGLRLYVEDENVSAHATYRALGMVETHYRFYEQLLRRRGE